MKTLLALLLTTTIASANTYRMDFSATGFGGSSLDIPPVVNTIDGSITYTADAAGGTITSFTAVDLNIAGHHYTPAEVGFLPIGGGTNLNLIGGTISGINYINGATDDFWLEYNAATLTATNLSYSASLRPVWDSWTVAFSVTEVPLPSALLLFVTGLGVVLYGTRKAS